MNKPPISRFRGENRFLSNFWETEFVHGGITYPTVEHAYQSMKTLDKERALYIREASTAGEAARRGRSIDTVIKPGWDDIRGDLMLLLVTAKFRQNDDLAERLLATIDSYLIEGNYWHDNYFGICTCKVCHHNVKGKNMLGRILMQVRAELKG